MKRLLKYLLLFLVTAAFWSGADEAVSSVSAVDVAALSYDEETSHASLSPTDTDFSPPRNTSVTSAPSLQNTARRTSSSYRNNFEFVKSGKVINSGILYFIQKKLISVHSSLMEPCNRLLYLGRLII